MQEKKNTPQHKSKRDYLDPEQLLSFLREKTNDHTGIFAREIMVHFRLKDTRPIRKAVESLRNRENPEPICGDRYGYSYSFKRLPVTISKLRYTGINQIKTAANIDKLYKQHQKEGNNNA